MKSCTLFQGMAPSSGRNWWLQTSGHTWGHRAVPQGSDGHLSPEQAQSSSQGSSCAAGVGTVPNTATAELHSQDELWHTQTCSGSLGAPQELGPHIPAVEPRNICMGGGGQPHPNGAGSEHSPTLPEPCRDLGWGIPTPGAEPSSCATLFTLFFQFEAPRTPSLHKHQHLLQSLPAGQPGLSLPCSCSVCTSYSSTAKPRKGRKNLQKAEIETASLLLSVLSKERENKATKANTDYSNNLFNLGKEPRKQPKKPKKGRGKPCVCVVNNHHTAVLCQSEPQPGRCCLSWG